VPRLEKGKRGRVQGPFNAVGSPARKCRHVWRKLLCGHGRHGKTANPTVFVSSVLHQTPRRVGGSFAPRSQNISFAAPLCGTGCLIKRFMPFLPFWVLSGGGERGSSLLLVAKSHVVRLCAPCGASRVFSIIHTHRARGRLRRCGGIRCPPSFHTLGLSPFTAGPTSTWPWRLRNSFEETAAAGSGGKFFGFCCVVIPVSCLQQADANSHLGIRKRAALLREKYPGPSPSAFQPHGR